MSDPCEYCLNNQQDEYGSALDEDEMARYLSHTTLSCPYFEPGDEYKIVRKQN
jgi:hypothetical protein